MAPSLADGSDVASAPIHCPTGTIAFVTGYCRAISSYGATAIATAYQFKPQERPFLPGSPAPGMLLGVTGGMSNGLLLANPPQIQGSLGLTPVEGGWRTAIYSMTGVCMLPGPVGIWSIRASVLTVFREVEDAFSAVARLASQRRALEKQRTALAETLRHATNRHRAGYSPYPEQLDATRALFGAELAVAQVRAGQLTALVALYRATGGGWGRTE